MPERERFSLALATHQRRLRTASIAAATVVAAVSAAMVVVGASLVGVRAGEPRTPAAIVFAVAAIGLAARWWKRWTPRRVAAAIESRVTGLDNVIVTAEEVLNTRRDVIHPIVDRALFADAVARLQAVTTGSVQPLKAPLALAALTLASAVAVVAALPPAYRLDPRHATVALEAPMEPLAAGDVRVVVTPPAYTGRAATSLLNPPGIVVVEGSHVRLEASREGGGLQVSEAGRQPAAFALVNDRWSHEFSASEPRVLLIQPTGARNGEGDRMLQVRVTPDGRPLVRIRVPARDLIFGEPRGSVPIEIEARDDLGLGSLSLRYTRVAGSGETFTFTEGELPVRIQRTNTAEWQGRALLALETLALEDGDTLVYRAVATDRKPGADPSTSDAFLIEIGRMAGVASTGFALPEERDRQAISQQMLIIKTERLEAERSRLSRENYEEQSRLLAVEQRMVKAEFVFMTGGEVADEVAEAEHAHELAEGRFENAAQVELLTAIREMSRAEARLNVADTTQALAFERAALRALQRAFDRRRYLLRTLPERARIDLARRLAGDRSDAQSPRRPQGNFHALPEVANARQAMLELSRAIVERQGLNAALASKVLAVDPDSDALQGIATTLASIGDLGARIRAARDAQQHLADFVSARLSAGPRDGIVDDPLPGRLADETGRTGGRP